MRRVSAEGGHRFSRLLRRYKFTGNKNFLARTSIRPALPVKAGLMLSCLYERMDQTLHPQIPPPRPPAWLPFLTRAPWCTHLSLPFPEAYSDRGHRHKRKDKHDRDIETISSRQAAQKLQFWERSALRSAKKTSAISAK